MSGGDVYKRFHARLEVTESGRVAVDLLSQATGLSKQQVKRAMTSGAVCGAAGWTCEEASLANDTPCKSDKCGDAATCQSGACLCPELENTCAEGSVLVGEFATWCGKVNVFVDPATGDWMSDPNCDSGCQENDLSYCQKLYPSATEIISLDLTDLLKPFKTAGCVDDFPNKGQLQQVVVQADAPARMPT